MATDKQDLGDFGEVFVAKRITCPGCKSTERTLRTLPRNFKCADVICDFCGYLAQVKTTKAPKDDLDLLPSTILGASWGPQADRMDAGVYFSLFIVTVTQKRKAAVYFLPRDLQTRKMFVPRNELSPTAKRSGWKGHMIHLDKALAKPTRLI